MAVATFTQRTTHLLSLKGLGFVFKVLRQVRFYVSGVMMEAFHRTILKSLIHLPLSLFAVHTSLSRIINLYFVSQCQYPKLFCFTTSDITAHTYTKLCTCLWLLGVFSQWFLQGQPCLFSFPWQLWLLHSVIRFCALQL